MLRNLLIFTATKEENISKNVQRLDLFPAFPEDGKQRKCTDVRHTSEGL